MFLKEFKLLLQEGTPVWYAPPVNYSTASMLTNSIKYIIPLRVTSISKKWVSLTYNNTALKVSTNNANNRIYTSLSDAELQIINEYTKIQDEYNKLQLYIDQFGAFKQDKPYLFI